MASFDEKYSFRKFDTPFRHKVCNSEKEMLEEALRQYEERNFQVLLDELIEDERRYNT